VGAGLPRAPTARDGTQGPVEQLINFPWQRTEVDHPPAGQPQRIEARLQRMRRQHQAWQHVRGLQQAVDVF
jgi:hypothetical protein